MVEEYKPKEKPSCLHLNLDKDKMPQSHMKLGAKMKFMVEAKVTSINQSEYGKMMDLDILEIEHEGMEDEDA